MKRPLLNRWERILLSEYDTLHTDLLKFRLAWVKFAREFVRANSWFFKLAESIGKSEWFVYLYVWLWLMQLSGIAAIIVHILNR